MSLRNSQRSSREWLLLAVAFILVAAVVIPLWRLTGTEESRSVFPNNWSPDEIKRMLQRLGKLLIGPEQAICYVCFTWSSLILLRRYFEVRRQRTAFSYELLPTDEGSRILPEDARPLARKVDQVMTKNGSTILANMIRLGLGKYAISKSGPDVAEVVRNQAEVEQSRLVATMGTVNYLAWAIPAVGFLGTVRGLAGAMGLSRAKDQDVQEYIDKYIDQVKDHLGTAFDCTFVALALSLVLMYILHSIQRSEETLVIDCQDYCQEHLLLRLYDPQPSDGVSLVIAGRG